MKNKYLIKSGDFAKLCNVSKDTLYHYEKLEILIPVLKNEKGYRFYSHNQVEKMFLIETLKKLNMSLVDIKYFISNNTPQNLLNKLENETINISNKIMEFKKLKKSIDKKIELLKSVENENFEEIKIEKVQREKLFLSKEINTVDNIEEKVGEFYEKCKVNMGMALTIGGIIRKENLINNKSSYSYLFVKNEEYSNYTKEKGLELIAYHKGYFDNISCTYNKINEYIKKHKLEIKDFIYEDTIYDMLTVSNTDDYITKISIPLENKKIYE